jgi:hypothetical protein
MMATSMTASERRCMLHARTIGVLGNFAMAVCMPAQFDHYLFVAGGDTRLTAVHTGTVASVTALV